MSKQEALETIKTGHIAEGLMVMAMYTGAKNLNAHPGLWEKKIDDTWHIKCNGHPEDLGGVPGLSWYIEYNGWPAGVMSVLGEGVLCAGEGGNEENLRIALIDFVNKN